MNHAIWGWWEHGKECYNGKWSWFCCVGWLCEGVDTNQRLPLQCKLCMNIKDVYFGDFLYAHMRTTSVLTFTFGHSLIFREFFAYLQLGIWDNLHTPKCKMASLLYLHNLTWKLVEVLIYWIVPIIKLFTQAVHSFRGEFDWSSFFLVG